jgi:hypothetical protein
MREPIFNFRQEFAAIVIGAALIAGAILFVFRYEIGPAAGGFVFRLDRWTGEVNLIPNTPPR